MLTTEMFVAIVGLCATFYTIGYTHGSTIPKQKSNRLALKKQAVTFCKS